IFKTNRPPRLVVNQPSTGDEIEVGELLLVSVLAGDPERDLDRVEIYDGDSLLITLTEEPYDWLWDDAALGQRNLIIKAFDSAGLSGTSENIVINVGPRDLTPKLIKRNNIAAIN